MQQKSTRQVYESVGWDLCKMYICSRNMDKTCRVAAGQGRALCLYSMRGLSKTCLHSAGKRRNSPFRFKKEKFSVLHDFFEIFLAILLTFRSGCCNIIIA